MKNETSLKKLIQTDLYRASGKYGLFTFVRYYFASKSVKISFWYRLLHHIYIKEYYVLLFFMKRVYRIIGRKYCIDLPYQTKIGKGILMFHVFGIVISGECLIGDNLTISHQVTIGDEKGFSPIIGNKVFISPGAKIFGKITIGNNIKIGANAVVNKSVPDNCVTVGVPNRIIHQTYIDSFNRRYYEE